MNVRDRSDDTILLDEPWLLMSHSAEDGLLHLEWKGHATSGQYRRALTMALDHLKKHDVRSWLADLVEMAAILKADEDWANTEWFPELFKTRLEKMAIIPSKDYFNQTSVQRSFTAVSGNITFEVRWFPTMPEALEWLYDKERSMA